MVLLNFIPIRFAGRDDANDFATLPIAVTDDPYPQGNTQPQKHETFFLVGVLGIGNHTSDVIQERYAERCRLSLVQTLAGPTPRKIFLQIKYLDRRLAVAPMMDWTG